MTETVQLFASTIEYCMRFIDTFDMHRSQPEKSLDQYLTELRLELGNTIAGRLKVYLDTKYWLLLRNHRLGRIQDCSVARLSGLLQAGVQTGRLICPISTDVFLEIIKQTDPETLYCSAELIDQLSHGICTIANMERLRMELLHFLRRNLAHGEDCYSPEVFVWTKVAYVLGFLYPSNTPFSPSEELIIQKALLDQMWSISLAEMIDRMGIDNIRNWPRMRDMSTELNEGKFAHAHENDTLNQVFLSELAGLLDAAKPMLLEAAAYLYECQAGQKPAAEEIEASNVSQTVANLIYNAFRLNKITADLPSIRIPAVVHAAIRYDARTKYKPTDLHDIHHATAALPYCDVFLTEKNMRHLLTRSDLALDRLYNCRVISEPDEAIKEIEHLISGRHSQVP